MKQQITKEQWEQLEWGEKDVLLNFFDVVGVDRDLCLSMGYLCYIGQLIEFLGNDLAFISKFESGWKLYTDIKEFDEEFYRKELIDALWESVKFKLKNI